MKVLVACEYSGVVRDAFLKKGHDAVSCDLLPTEVAGPHIEGDVREWLQERWDLVIAHPPCTDLSRANGTRKPAELVAPAIDFFLDCLNANAPKVAVENPVMFKYIRKFVGEPDCLVHPYQFGDAYLKATCWWLRGLPPLMPLMNGEDGSLPLWVRGQSKSKRPGINGGPGYRHWKDRSRFHPGMAKAMAEQWG